MITYFGMCMVNICQKFGNQSSRLSQYQRHSCNGCRVIVLCDSDCQSTPSKSACFCHSKAEVVILKGKLLFVTQSGGVAQVVSL